MSTHPPNPSPGGQNPRTGKSWFRLAALGLILLAMAAGLWHRFIWERPVHAAMPESRQLQRVVKGAGELVAREQLALTSKTAMAVKSVLVDVGSEVRRGQPLVLLESNELAAQLRLAQAAERAAFQGIEVARVAQQRFAVVHRRSEADAQRALRLAGLDPDAISATEVDGSTSSAKSAALDAQGSQFQAQAALHAHAEAVAQLELARTRWRDATLRAPFDGLVVKRQCSPGDVLAPGAPCLTLVNPASLHVQVRFDESALARLHLGDAVQLTLKSHPQAGLRGRIERFNRAVDTDTREFSVDVSLDPLPKTWALGERATAQVGTAMQPVKLAIPVSHVVNTPDGPTVWAAREGRAERAVLKLGLSDGHQIEVLEGLAATDAVLAPKGMRPFLRVKPQPQAW